MKPFLSEKGVNYGTKITLDEKGKFISNEAEVAEIFNDQYINIVEKTTGLPPDSIPNKELNVENITETIKNIIAKYNNHPSIKAIYDNNENTETFNLPLAKISDVKIF